MERADDGAGLVPSASKFFQSHSQALPGPTVSLFEYSRFQSSSTIELFGRTSRGFFAFSSFFGAGAGAAAFSFFGCWAGFAACTPQVDPESWAWGPS